MYPALAAHTAAANVQESATILDSLLLAIKAGGRLAAPLLSSHGRETTSSPNHPQPTTRSTRNSINQRMSRDCLSYLKEQPFPMVLCRQNSPRMMMQICLCYPSMSTLASTTRLCPRTSTHRRPQHLPLNVGTSPGLHTSHGPVHHVPEMTAPTCSCI